MIVTLVLKDDPTVVFGADVVTKVSESYYYVEITATVRGTYDLLIEIVDLILNESLGFLG